MDVVAFLARGTIAWLLLSAALSKAHGDGAANFEDIVRRQFELSPSLSKTARFGLITLETGVGLGLFVPLAWPYFAVSASAIFVLFAVVLAMWLKEGGPKDCGCRGLMPVQEVSARHIAALVLLAGAATAISGYGLQVLGTRDTHEEILGLGLLTMWLPLPVLGWVAVVRQLLHNRATLRSLDDLFFRRES